MLKPERLTPGDKIAVVSLSWGGLGDPGLIHKYHIAKARLEEEFGLQVVPMPHALKGTEFVAKHPELRAQDLMDAFRDPSVSAIFCAIGGNDSIRLLPFIDFDVIRQNPKIFMGYSDSTVSHLMMYKAGLTSFYGPSIMCEFGEYVSMFDYTKAAVQHILFESSANYSIPSSPEWSGDFVPWAEENAHIGKTLKPDKRGYEVLQGGGITQGHLLGGCIEVFSMVLGTPLWPTLEQWKDAILFVETSEELPTPEYVKYTFRNLAAQGILKSLKGILVGKPKGEVYYEEYKAAILQVVTAEEGLTSLPILYNVNFGHAMPIGVLPYGVMAELDCDKKTITLLESATR